MKTDVKKETSTTPTKTMVEVSQKEKKKKSFSLSLYHSNTPLSTSPKRKIYQAYFEDKKCVMCGKNFVPTRPYYAWEDCCSYTCRIHRDDHKKIVNGKPVDMFTTEGVYLDSFPSAMEAAKHIGMKQANNIRDCCLGKTKTSGGFVWRYKEEK